MTVVRPELQFGVAELNGDGVVRGFIEKPRSEHWVNGGFFCFEPAVLELLERGQRARARAARARWPAPASCARSGTRASGTAWTPTRTPSCSTTCGLRATLRGSCGTERALGARHGRLRAARVVAGQGAARAGRAGGRDPPRRAGRLGAAGARASRLRSTSSTATSAPTDWSRERSPSTRSTASSTSRRRRSSGPPTARRPRRSRRTSAAPGWCSRHAGRTASSG